MCVDANLCGFESVKKRACVNFAEYKSPYCFVLYFNEMLVVLLIVTASGMTVDRYFPF